MSAVLGRFPPLVQLGSEAAGAGCGRGINFIAPGQLPVDPVPVQGFQKSLNVGGELGCEVQLFTRVGMAEGDGRGVQGVP